jgi:methylphosphotriester-DNA--protein-cysteine methyltransferase
MIIVHQAVVNKTTTENTQASGSSDDQYVDSNGNGLIKGSKSKIYHVPGSKYYEKTTSVVQWFKTTQEAEAAGYRAPEN